MSAPTDDPAERVRIADEKLKDEVLRSLPALRESGKGEDVLTALRSCSFAGLDCPPWVIETLAVAAHRYLSADVRTLDEALGLIRAAPGKRWRQPEARFDQEFGHQCFFLAELNIRGANDERVSYSPTEAYELVAELLGNGATAEKVKRNHLRWKESYEKEKRLF